MKLLRTPLRIPPRNLRLRLHQTLQHPQTLLLHRRYRDKYHLYYRASSPHLLLLPAPVIQLLRPIGTGVPLTRYLALAQTQAQALTQRNLAI